MKRNRLCVPVGEWQTLPHHPNLRSRISRWAGGQPFLTTEPNAVEFPGACLPQAGTRCAPLFHTKGGGVRRSTIGRLSKVEPIVSIRRAVHLDQLIVFWSVADCDEYRVQDDSQYWRERLDHGRNLRPTLRIA
jgi:hypothetical protein